MILIIGVKFRKSNKIYYFDPTGYEVKRGDHVIVETVRGIEYGTVALGPKEITDDKLTSPLKPIMRIATEADDAENEENQKKEKEAFGICLEKIEKHQLKMKLIDSEYTFNRNKLLFYFTADGRVDFRELVKDLASVFRTRIELRQIGVRDETKLLGGIAMCGRPLCCHSYLSDFAPVSIKMAKEQGLSLNPTQISGVCGRLMCCLKNEQEAYEYLNQSLPAIGAKVRTSDGYTGEVQNTNILKQLVKVVITKNGDEKEIREYPVTELSFDDKSGNRRIQVESSLDESIDPKELEQLQQMEEQDLKDMAEEEAAEQEERTAYRREKRENRYPKGTRHDRQGRQSYSDRTGPSGRRERPDQMDSYSSGQTGRDRADYERSGQAGRDRADYGRSGQAGRDRAGYGRSGQAGRDRSGYGRSRQAGANDRADYRPRQNEPNNRTDFNRLGQPGAGSRTDYSRPGQAAAGSRAEYSRPGQAAVGSRAEYSRPGQESKSGRYRLERSQQGSTGYPLTDGEGSADRPEGNRHDRRESRSRRDRAGFTRGGYSNNGYDAAKRDTDHSVRDGQGENRSDSRHHGSERRRSDRSREYSGNASRKPQESSRSRRYNSSHRRSENKNQGNNNG